MTITLRPHQQAGHDAVFNHWRNGGGNPVLSHCVGSGKSLTIAAIGKTVLTAFPGARVLCLTMTKELLEQNEQALLKYWPAAPAGMNSAGLKRRDTKADFLFAHPLSVYRSPKSLGPRHVLLIDEVHNVSRKQEKSVYGKIITSLRDLVSDLRIVGLSGTIWRLDSGRLTDEWKGEAPMWDACVHEYTITEGIEDGYLVEPITRRPGTIIDVSGVGTRGGEYVDSQLQAAVDKSDVTDAIVDDLLKQTTSRNSVIVFATGISHAEHLHEALKARGAQSVVVHGELDDKDRDARIDFFKRGAAKFLVNVGIATTGFNHPPVDCVALCRPTQSSGLLIQMIGRGLRIAPGKADCLVLDYAANVTRLGCIDQIDGKKFAGVGGKAPTKTCPKCQTVAPASALKCKEPTCDHEWPAPKPDLETEAVAAPILSAQADEQWLDVQRVSYSIHQRIDFAGKPGPKSLLIQYYISYGHVVKEWIGFDSPKPGALAFAQRKWIARCSTDYVPGSTIDAFAHVGMLRKPGRIRTKKEGKYDTVTGHDFSVGPTREPLVA